MEKDQRIAYRVTEVPAVTGLRRSNVYELIARGVIPSVRIGGRILVPAEGLRRAIESAPSAAHDGALVAHGETVGA